MSELASVHADRAGSVPVARVSGEIDLSNAEEVRGQIQGVMVEVEAAPGLVLDLSGVRYLDSTGIRLVFDLARWLGSLGAGLRMVLGDSSAIQPVLSASGVSDRIPVHGTVEEAAAAFSA
jgi:anti-anti-sigma factor